MQNNKGLTDEKKNANYVLWIEYLKKYDCYTDELIEKYGEKIKNGSYSMTEDNGGCGEGTLLDTVLKTLCVIATHINEEAFGLNKNEKYKHKHLYVDKNSLMKVLLIQHISKCELFVPSTESWKLSKGFLYSFNDNIETTLKLGERSIYMAMNCGVRFTEEEYEAVKILDKDDDKPNSFLSPLSQLVKTANQLTAIENYRKYKEKK